MACFEEDNLMTGCEDNLMTSCEGNLMTRCVEAAGPRQRGITGRRRADMMCDRCAARCSPPWRQSMGGWRSRHRR